MEHNVKGIINLVTRIVASFMATSVMETARE